MSVTVSESLTEPGKTVTLAVEAANFRHLYWDVAWFGLAFGSTLSFLPVFAARMGATSWQVGLLTAGPALVNALFTMSAGRWLENRPLGQAVVQTAFWQRFGFFLLIPIPLLIPAEAQVWSVLLLVLLMAIPGTALAVGFNALLAATVRPEARGRIVGRRNGLLAGMIMAAFLLSGWVLDHLSFEWGYTVVFIIGAVGGGMSTYHLSRVVVPPLPHFKMRPTQDRAQPGRGTGQSGDAGQRLNVGMRLWLRWRPDPARLTSPISARYRGVMLAFFLFHFVQMLPAALFPLFWVHEIHLTDGQIGWLNATFYLAMLLFSPLLEPLTKHLGNYRLAVLGCIGLAIYPFLTAMSYGMPLLLVTSVIGGAVWAILSGALVNRLLEVTPADQRPSHLAFYNLALNVATLVGTMLGPLLADVTGLRETLFLIAILRVGSGLAMARWG